MVISFRSLRQGAVYVNNGARDALKERLQPASYRWKNRGFLKGDIIRILDSNGEQVGIGKSQYDSEKAEKLIGAKRKSP